MEWKVVEQMLCHAAGKQQEESSQWDELKIWGEKNKNKQSQKTVNHSNYEAKCA